MGRFLKITAILAISGAYLAWPLDIIPDVLIGPGQLDDFAILAFAYQQIKSTIRKTKGSNSIASNQSVCATEKR